MAVGDGLMFVSDTSTNRNMNLEILALLLWFCSNSIYHRSQFGSRYLLVLAGAILKTFFNIFMSDDPPSPRAMLVPSTIAPTDAVAHNTNIA